MDPSQPASASYSHCNTVLIIDLVNIGINMERDCSVVFRVTGGFPVKFKLWVGDKVEKFDDNELFKVRKESFP